MSETVSPRQIAALAAGHTREAADMLAGPGDIAARVHQARRSLKRARSLVRALAPLAPKAARLENRALRGYARALAPLRDAHALEAAAVAVDARGFMPPAKACNVDLGLLAAGLAREAERTEGLPVRRRARCFAAETVAHAYRRARRAFRRYRSEPAEAALHEARKRVKDCLHLVEAMQAARPKGAEPKAKRLEALGGLMGDLRDLDLVAANLPADQPSRTKRLRIAARRLRLERAVARVGTKTFAARPREVRRAWLGR